MSEDHRSSSALCTFINSILMGFGRWYCILFTPPALHYCPQRCHKSHWFHCVCSVFMSLIWTKLDYSEDRRLSPVSKTKKKQNLCETFGSVRVSGMLAAAVSDWFKARLLSENVALGVAVQTVWVQLNQNSWENIVFYLMLLGKMKLLNWWLVCLCSVCLSKGKDGDEQPPLTVDIGEPHTEALEETVVKGVDLVYSLNDKPPWYLCILLGFQVI